MAERKTTEDELIDCRNGIILSIQRWNGIKENGCNDPFWTDGINMNLVRNQIIYYKRRVMEICESECLLIPEEYYLPTPPKVDNDFMANLDNKERVERLRRYGNNLIVKNIEFNSKQLTLF